MPIASESPSSDIVSSLKPSTQTAMNDAITETGRARPVMTVERHELRKRKTTSTVRNAPSTSVSCTLVTECSTFTPEFFTTSIVVPGGSVFRICSTRARICDATSVVL